MDVPAPPRTDSVGLAPEERRHVEILLGAASPPSARVSERRRRQDAPGAGGRAGRDGSSSTLVLEGLISTLRSVKPVAITVMRTSSCSVSSITAPKMMLASSCAASWTIFAASSTSWMDMSGPPVKLMRMPRAPSMDVSSSSGLATAFWAASSARFWPLPAPAPISAMPMPDMIVRTSAKSRLIRPGTRIRSEMPCTAWSSTVSATLKASTSGVPRSTTASRRWLGIVIRVSTTLRSSAMPASACCWRAGPRSGTAWSPPPP